MSKISVIKLENWTHPPKKSMFSQFQKLKNSQQIEVRLRIQEKIDW